MNKTVYLREDEVSIWERARELSGDKLSGVIVGHLRHYVAEKDAPVEGYERMVIRLYDSGIPQANGFYGRWLIPPSELFVPPPPRRAPRKRREPSGFDALAEMPAQFAAVTAAFGPVELPPTFYFAVAETRKRNYVVLRFTGVIKEERHREDTFLEAKFFVIDSLKSPHAEIPPELQAEALERLGVVVQELDI